MARVTHVPENNENTPIKSSSWFVKIVLGLIVLSFAFWGVSDYFQRSGNSDTIAEVGNIKISREYFRSRLQPFLQAFHKEFPDQTEQDFFALGLAHQALESLIREIVIDLEIQRLGLTVSDEMMRRYIRMDPTFHTNGKFDKEKMASLLKRTGLSEQKFLLDGRMNLLRRQLMYAVAGSVRVPEGLLTQIVKNIMEERTVMVARLDAKTLKGQHKEPTADDLKTFYEAHKNLFMHPEVRAFTVLTIGKEGAQGADRQSFLVEIEDEIAGGKSLEEVAKDRNLTLASVALVDKDGKFQDKSLKTTAPKAAVMKVAFATEEKTESLLTREDDGSAFILRVDEVVPAGHFNPQDIQEDLKAQWKWDQDVATSLAQTEAWVAAWNKSSEGSRVTPKVSLQTERLSRQDGKILNLKPDDLSRIFAAKENQAMAFKTPQGAAMVVVKSIHPVKGKKLEEGIAKLRPTLNEAFLMDLLSTYMAALREKYGVEIHEELLAAMGRRDE